MAKEKDDYVVIAMVKDQDTAKADEKALKKWDKGDKDLKLGNIGWIYKKKDKVKTHMERDAGKGAETGAAIGIIATQSPIKTISINRKIPAASVDKRPRPPDLTLITDWPIMAQPAMPPRKPAAILAMP